MTHGRIASLLTAILCLAAFVGPVSAQDKAAAKAEPPKAKKPKPRPAPALAKAHASVMSDPAKAGYLAIEKIKAISTRSKSVEVALPALERIARTAVDPGVRRAALFAISDIHVKYGQPAKAAMALAVSTSIPQAPPARTHPPGPRPAMHVGQRPQAAGGRLSDEDRRRMWQQGLERLHDFLSERWKAHQRAMEDSPPRRPDAHRDAQHPRDGQTERAMQHRRQEQLHRHQHPDRPQARRDNRDHRHKGDDDKEDDD